jgi:hypothetical protein
VWSYGVLLWELFSKGALPYTNLSNNQMGQYLLSGGRLLQPERCPFAVYELMILCWHPDPAKRPSFRQLFARMNQIYFSKELSNTMGPPSNIRAAHEVYRSDSIVLKRWLESIIAQHCAEHIAAAPPQSPYHQPQDAVKIEIQDEVIRAPSQYARSGSAGSSAPDTPQMSRGAAPHRPIISIEELKASPVGRRRDSATNIAKFNAGTQLSGPSMYELPQDTKPKLQLSPSRAEAIRELPDEQQSSSRAESSRARKLTFSSAPAGSSKNSSSAL